MYPASRQAERGCLPRRLQGGAYIPFGLYPFKMENQVTVSEKVPSLFVPEPKPFNNRQACRSGKGWRFFRYTDAKKYYLLPDCLDRLCLAGYNQSGDGRVTCLLLFRSHPARRRGYGPASQTCSVQVGRGNAVNQADALRT